MKPNKIINAINTSWWIDNAIIAVLYFVFGALVLKLPQSPLGSPFWPSAGIAVGALLARGQSRWFGIFFGAALNSFLNSKVPFIFAIMAGLAPAIGALVATTLVLHFNKTNYFLGYVKHFVVFALAATFSGTILQALFGAAIVLWAGLIPWNIYWTVTLGWWVGDVVGILVFAPLILAWWNKETKIKLNKIKQRLDILDNQFDPKELFFAVAILSVISYLALIESQPIEYLLLPSLLWSAFRFGSKITTLLVTTTAMVASISTAYRIGIFYKVSQESSSLLLLQLFMGVISITAIVVLSLDLLGNKGKA